GDLGLESARDHAGRANQGKGNPGQANSYSPKSHSPWQLALSHKPGAAKDCSEDQAFAASQGQEAERGAGQGLLSANKKENREGHEEEEERGFHAARLKEGWARQQKGSKNDALERPANRIEALEAEDGTPGQGKNEDRAGVEQHVAV